MAHAFLKDCVELAAERVERGQLDRRTFLQGLAALGLGGFGPAVLAPGRAEAQAKKPKEIVMVNWGGEALPRRVGEALRSRHRDQGRRRRHRALGGQDTGDGRGEERDLGRLRLGLGDVPRDGESLFIDLISS